MTTPARKARKSPPKQARGVTMKPMTDHARKARIPRHRRLTRGQIRTVVTLIVIIAAGLALYSAAASYETLSALAASKGVALPQMNPLGIDGGLFGVIMVSIALIWIGMPLGWLMGAARLFGFGTIALNAAAGWPDPVGMLLRMAAPALFVILVEAGRAVLVRHDRDAGGVEGIPLARWLLAPWPTFCLYRRMKLWRVRDYREAVSLELSRLKAIDKLAEFYGDTGWRKAAPRYLVRMLREGTGLDEAVGVVAELTAPAPEPAPAKSAPARRSQRPVSAARSRRTSAPADEVVTDARAGTMLAAEPEMTGAELARRLGVSPSHGRRLKAAWSARSQDGERSPGAGDERARERSASAGG